MKHFMKLAVAAICMTIAAILFSGCEKDSGLSGLYVTDREYNYNYDSYRSGYYFKSSSQVVYYSELYSSKPKTGNGYLPVKSIKIGSSEWYVYVYDNGQSDGKSYTYVKDGNTITIPMQGVILQQDGKNLAQDGSSRVFRKY